LPRRKGTRKKGALSGFAILIIRAIVSSVVVAVVTGINVIQVFIQNPWEFHTKLYQEIYKAGNLAWILILMFILYVTDLDKPLLKILGLWLEEDEL